MNFKKGYFDSNHTGRNGCFVREGYRLPSGAEDAITDESSRGTDDTYYAIKAKSGNANSTARLFGLKSVDLDALFLDRTTELSGGTFYDAVSGELGMCVESYCAKSDGSTGYITMSDLPATSFSSFEAEITLHDNLTAGDPYQTLFIGQSGSFISFFSFKPSDQKAYFVSLKPGESYVNRSIAFDSMPVAGDTIKGTFYSGQLHLYVNDVEQAASPVSLGSSLFYNNGFTSNRLFSSASGYANKKYSNAKLTLDGTLFYHLPLQGSTYDVSGNGNHGTINGSISLTETQDVYHYNLTNGFGIGPELLVDGDMEAAGTSAWLSVDSTLTKVSSTLPDSTQCLRISYSAPTFWAVQNPAGVGVVRMVGYARSDGTNTPKVIYNYGSVLKWTGTTSTEWQKFDVVGYNYGSIWIGSSGFSGWVEFDNISVKEVYIPRLADDSGWAAPVDEEHLAGPWHNGAETKLVLGTTGAAGYPASAWLQSVDTDNIFHTGTTCKKLSYDDLQAISSDYVRFNDEEYKLRNISIYDLSSPLADSFLATLVADRLTIYLDEIHEVEVDQDRFITAGLFFDFTNGNLEVYIDGTLEDTISLPVGFTLSSSSDLTIGSNEADFPAPVTLEYLHIGDEVVHDLEQKYPTKTWGKVIDPNPNEIEDGDMSAPDTSAYTAGANTLLAKLDDFSGIARSLMVRNSGGGNASASQTCMEVGRIYRVTGKARATDTASTFAEFVVGATTLFSTSNTDWTDFDVTFTATSTDISLETNNPIIGRSSFWAELKMVEVGKTYYTIPFKTDFGVYANENTISDGVIENTPFWVVSGSFKITTDTYEGDLVKVIECVSSGSFKLQQSVEGTTFTYLRDTGSGYSVETQSSSTFAMNAGDKIIYSNINGAVVLCRT